MEKKIFKHGEYSYDYSLVREDCQSISLTVQPDLTVTVKCPEGYSQERIEAFLTRNLKKMVGYIVKLDNLKHKTG